MYPICRWKNSFLIQNWEKLSSMEGLLALQSNRFSSLLYYYGLFPSTYTAALTWLSKMNLEHKKQVQRKTHCSFYLLVINDLVISEPNQWPYNVIIVLHHFYTCLIFQSSVPHIPAPVPCFLPWRFVVLCQAIVLPKHGLCITAGIFLQIRSLRICMLTMQADSSHMSC